MQDTKTSPLVLLFQLFRFGIVGVLAAVVHFLVANTLTVHTGIHVAYTNIAGFLCAFWVSFFGHHFFSFQVDHLSLWQTLPKFALVALLFQ
jgi:putative flippase GtrA